jgi:hypothetical protein
MNVALHWKEQRNRPASIGDEGARSHGVNYRVSADPLLLPQSARYSATADQLNLGAFNLSAPGRDAAHDACQKHANRIGEYLDGAGPSPKAANDPTLTAKLKRLRATHAALSLVRNGMSRMTGQRQLQGLLVWQV